jgi:nicotinamidase-related amidase
MKENVMNAPRRALIVVDVQQEYFDGILQVHYPPRDETLANITRALDAAAQHEVPIVVVQHEDAEDSPVFAVGSPSWTLHPEIERRLEPTWKRVSKEASSVFVGTDITTWLSDQEVDTITVVGFMTNNCDIATAVEAEGLGLSAEILSDASGAIHLANEVGSVSAEQLHQTLMVMLHSNFAAVATTDKWVEAVISGQALPKGDLGSSATQGRSLFV